MDARDWFGCYSSGWRNEIVPEAFSHPAKFARGLIRRIYEHALERGYLKEDDVVLDPFGGVALGAADALANGLNFVGVELEQNFVDLGAGCDCTGIGEADWVACFGRWRRFAHAAGQHWCPRCLAEAERVIEPRPPTLPGMEPGPTASYQRSSGKIPHTEPHYYIGNLDLFARHARGNATAVLMQGDSRRLCEVLAGARAEGLISSPPYATSATNGARENRIANLETAGIDSKRWLGKRRCTQGRSEGYGTSPAQLGNMPTGEPPKGIITSPPYATQTVHDRCGIDPKKLTGNPPGPHSQVFTMADYGDSDGQLGTMPTGEPPQAVIGSPPHGTAGVGHDAGHPRLDATEDARREAEGCGRRPAYGKSDGQLAAMHEGDAPTDYTHTPGSLTPTQFDAKAVTESIAFTTAPKREEAVECEWEEESVDGIIASPPYANRRPEASGSGVNLEKQYQTYRAQGGGASFEKFCATQKVHSQNYGTSDGQLAAMREGEPPAGIVSSPPWESSSACEDPNYRTNRQASGGPLYNDYGNHPDQLGNQQNDTFWSAAKTILLQCHQVLAPGGVAIFVTKRFVRDKKIVEFSQQWADLCQSCGFELVEWIKAWLVEERGTQYDLEGEAHTKTVKRFSFFRRLHAQKYPHLAIEWEDVLIFRKGKQDQKTEAKSEETQ